MLALLVLYASHRLTSEIRRRQQVSHWKKGFSCFSREITKMIAYESQTHINGVCFWIPAVQALKLGKGAVGCLPGLCFLGHCRGGHEQSIVSCDNLLSHKTMAWRRDLLQPFSIKNSTRPIYCFEPNCSNARPLLSSADEPPTITIECYPPQKLWIIVAISSKPTSTVSPPPPCATSVASSMITARTSSFSAQIPSASATSN